MQFDYDKIFDINETQDDIFDIIAKNKISNALEGINSTIFAYGQTGSGKTFSIIGGDSYQDRGLIPRTIESIFDEIAHRQKKDLVFKCQISFTEIYKENVYDLLDPLKKEKNIEQWTPVQVYEGEHGIVLKNVNVYEIDTEEEALNLFFMGNTNRITSSTLMNSASSRSHAIFSIVIESEGLKGDRTIMTCGKINLVDLAGSERMYKTNNSKILIEEAKSINLALHYLEQVIVSLRDEARQQSKSKSKAISHIPYRNSLLTSMLRDSLGGNCQSCFILTISPERSNFEETVSTLRFGQRCGEVKLQISANTMVGLPDQLKELSVKIKGLEKQLHAVESQKLQLLEDLELEKSKRRLACEPRTLSNDEKLECKVCVQNLLAAAKDAIDNPDDESDDTNRIIIEKSQEDLYDALEKMDKPILIELSSALGGLVQSMYLEREKMKRKQRKDAKQDLMRDPASVFDISTRSSKNNEVISLNDTQLKMITTGSTFMKFGRFGMKSARFVYLTDDLKNICWRHIGTNAAPTTFPLRNFQSASVDRSLVKADSGSSCLIVISGRFGNRSLHLEYAGSASVEENRKAAILWSDCINSCILKEEGLMKIKP